MERRIGASEVPALFTEAGAYRLYAIKSGLIQPSDEDSEAMMLGRELEAGVLRCAGLDVERTQPEYATGAPLHIVAHPDAVCRDGWLIEIKTTGLTGRSDWPDDDLPERVTYQVQTQLLASGAPGCMVVALIAGKGLKRYRVMPDKVLQGVIAKKILTLWQQVDGAIPPPEPVEEVEAPSIVPTPDKVLTLDDPNMEQLLARYCEVRDQIKAGEKTLADLKAQIEEAIGDAAKVQCGWYTISRTVVKQLRLDRKLFDAQPSWFSESSYIRFDVKNKGE